MNKDGRTKPLGDPQRLELPSRRCAPVSMAFVTDSPQTASWFYYITTLVDRFSKSVNPVPSRRTDTAIDVSNCFFDNIFWLHGLPDSGVSDRYPRFTSKFRSHLMCCCGIQLKMSTSRHPQTDGSTEIKNRMCVSPRRLGNITHYNRMRILFSKIGLDVNVSFPSRSRLAAKVPAREFFKPCRRPPSISLWVPGFTRSFFEDHYLFPKTSSGATGDL